MKNRAIDRGLDPRSGNSQPPRLFVWTPDSSCGSHQYYQLATHLSGAREEQGWAFWTLKRSFDIGVSGLALALLLPVFVMIAVGIRLESRVPVFFRQLRMGERLRLFKILKFRTMRASAQGSTLTVFDPELRRHRRPHALEDPRLTRVGAVLRRWSLDELPQLINILRGEMSLVGPRPLSLVESLAIPEEGWRRYSVPPGLTGLAQICDRKAIFDPSRIELDLEYTNELSLVEDLRILLLTVTRLKQ